MSEGVRLDVRSIPPAQRHAQIFSAFAALDAEAKLTLISDHEPRPLHTQFEQRYGGRYRWEQRQLGDGQWEVQLSWADVPSESGPIEATLRRSSIFGELPQAALHELAYRSRRATIRRHHCVVEQGTHWPYIGVVESGIVRAMVLTETGREHALYDLFPGDVFGEIALLDQGETPVRHVALTAGTTVVLVPVDEVRSLLRTQAALLSSLWALAAQRFRVVLNNLSTLLSGSAMARVAHALLPYAQPASGLTDALPPLPSMTQGEIAASAGTVKEVVSRALAELEDAGALARVRGHVVKLDRDKLIAAME